MSFNIDIAIFVSFLVVNLVVGLTYGRGVKNINDYAVGDRNFSTGTIAATLIATWIGGGFFAWNLSKAYSDGLPFITAVIGNGLSVFLLGYFYGPRIGEFLGCNSVAEAMGKLYGNKVRIITALAAIALSVGYTGLQIKVLSNLINWSVGINNIYATMAATFVVIIYSTFGGIKAVTFTDVIQFLTFGTFVPGLALLIWGSFDNPEVVFDVVKNNDLFDYKSLLTLSWLTMFLWFTCPGLDPALFQRILIARNVIQVRKSFIIASLGCMVIIMLTSWIGLLMYAKNPNLNPDSIITSIIHQYSYSGLRGMTIAGIAAMVMSTVDSYINSASVLFANDICQVLGIDIKKHNRGLLISRCFAIIMGLIALMIALSHSDLYQLTLMISNFYMPIVTIPLTMAIFGFRSTGKSVLIGIAAGIVTLLFWRRYLLYTGIDSVIPGMIANLIFLLGSHYILRQPGGWIGIKDQESFAMVKAQKERNWQRLVLITKQFNFIEFCKKNSPKEDYGYSYFAIFSIISVFSTIYTLPQSVQNNHQEILSLIYHSVLITSTIFLTYPIWPSSFKNETVISILWNIGIYYILVCVSIVFVIISHFGQFQLMMFVLNIFVISTISKWQVTLLLVPIASTLTVQFYKWHLNIDTLIGNIGTLQYKIIYFLLLVSSALIAFIRPRQEKQKLTEMKNEHLIDRITNQERELKEAQSLRAEFIRNVTHEYHAPMTGVINTAQILWESYEKLSDKQRQTAAESIFRSSVRLENFDANIISLSKLSKIDYELKLTPIDLSQLLRDRVDVCRKLYQEDAEDREFIEHFEDNIIINGDEYYLKQALDNLIINAISYCKKEKITILLKKEHNQICLEIIDEGIGIPVEELDHIFEEFIVSSRTRSPAGGRGIGLTLCKRVIEVHKGSITAHSNGDKGAIFKVILPSI
ncbi:MAG: alkaline phosphatase [Rickettsiaceae bacterium]|nr:MAG: alkaline phosphatase [Rickettsiaceae bacterium]